jgi:hypothetical protein
MVVNIHALGTSLYHVYTGQATWSDLLTIGLTTVAGLKYLRGGCFVGETLVVLDDGRQVAAADEIIADAGTTTFIPGLDMQELGGFVQSMILIIGVVGLAITEADHHRRQAELAAQAKLDALFGPPDNDDQEDEDDSMPYISDDDWLDPLAEDSIAARNAFDDQEDWLWRSHNTDVAHSDSNPSVAPPSPAASVATAPQSALISPGLAKPPIAHGSRQQAKTSLFSLRGSGILWFLLCIALVGASNYATRSVTPPRRRLEGTAPAGSPRTVPIKDIQLGFRVAGRDPLPYEAEVCDPEPETWRQINLHMLKQDGRSLRIELLRPLEWIETEQASIGNVVHLSLPEMGACGDATVLSIAPCPSILPGRGAIVTGKYVHDSDGRSVINLHIDGQSEPLGVTANHLFWSQSRQEFVAATDLHPFESIDTEFGVREVICVTACDYSGNLYNIETTEHVYRVGALGALVHNTCAGDHHFVSRALGSRTPYRHSSLTWLNQAEHTRVHAELNKFLRDQTKTLAGGKVVDMMPRRGNSGAEIMKNFTKQERLSALSKFYKQFDGGKYHQNFLSELKVATQKGWID